MIDVCSPSSWANFEDVFSRKTFSKRRKNQEEEEVRTSSKFKVHKLCHSYIDMPLIATTGELNYCPKSQQRTFWPEIASFKFF